MVVLMRLGYDQPEDVVVRPEVRTLLDELDVRVAALTNDLSVFHPLEWIVRRPVLRRFDSLIDLSSAGVLKPDPAEAFRDDDRPLRPDRRHPRPRPGGHALD